MASCGRIICSLTALMVDHFRTRDRMWIFSLLTAACWWAMPVAMMCQKPCRYAGQQYGVTNYRTAVLWGGWTVAEPDSPPCRRGDGKDQQQSLQAGTGCCASHRVGHSVGAMAWVCWRHEPGSPCRQRMRSPVRSARNRPDRVCGKVGRPSAKIRCLPLAGPPRLRARAAVDHTTDGGSLMGRILPVT